MHPIVLTGSRLPPRLFDLAEPPSALYLRGELPRGPCVAIVGTRTPTAEGVRFTLSLAAELARAGVAVLSGGALGIDTAAHRGALRGRGETVVAAPAGFERAYPPENRALFQSIVRRRGAYVSLVPDDESATQAAFFARNALLVALAHVVVVVQAGLRSGARNAAAVARRLGRPLLVVPSAPWIPRGQGCIAELRGGAGWCTGALDVLRALHLAGLRPISKKLQRRRSGRRPALSAPAQLVLPGAQRNAELVSDFSDSEIVQRICGALTLGPLHADELVQLVGLPVALLNRVLLTLRLQGVLASDPSGRLALLNSSN